MPTTADCTYVTCTQAELYTLLLPSSTCVDTYHHHPPTYSSASTMSRAINYKHGYYGQGSVEISPAPEGETGVRRCAISKDKLETQPVEGVNTVFDIVEYAARTHGSRDALGWREVVRIHEEEKEVTKTVDGKEVKEKKKWKYFELSDFQFHSFIDVKNIVSEIGRGLLELGIAADEVFNIYAQTRWVVSHSTQLFIDQYYPTALTGN